MNTSSSSPNLSCRAGLTLLEVLVACGILVIGLAGVAALLPAAASVLADASRIDRVANLATNAVADLRFQGMLSAARFQGPVKTLVIGSMFLDTPFGQHPFEKQVVPPTPLDEQAYGRAWYGATITPLSKGGEIKKGMPAKATVVVFSRQDVEAKSIRLTRLRPGLYRMTEGTVEQQEANLKRFLPGCAWAAVVTDDTVRWLHVGNSWANYTKLGQNRADKKAEQWNTSSPWNDSCRSRAPESRHQFVKHVP